MLFLTQLLTVLSSFYLMVVSICVCKRMDKHTSHIVRVFVIALGALGSSCIVQIFCNYPFTRFDVVLFSLSLVFALIVGIAPRIKTESRNDAIKNTKTL